MRIKFRVVKDVAYVPLNFLLAGPLPMGIVRFVLWCVGLFAKACYFIPGNPARRACGNYCKVVGRDDPFALFSRMIDNFAYGMATFAGIARGNTDEVADLLELDERSREILERVKAEGKGCIMIFPHCAASLVSVAGLQRMFDALLLVRESRSERRAALQKEQFQNLKTELFFVRSTDAKTVARAILNGLKVNKFVLALTDRLWHFRGHVIDKERDMVQVEAFGQKVMLAGWPARFSMKRKAPLLPGYLTIRDGKIIGIVDEPYVADDLVAGTQRWVDYFEKMYREYPEDWMFLLDKRRARVFEVAAAAGESSGSEQPAQSPST